MWWNDSHVTQYTWASVVAFLASFVRAARWYDGALPGQWYEKVRWSGPLSEVPLAIVLGVISVGVGSYYKADPTIVGAIAGGLGLAGPTALSLLIQSKFKSEGAK